MTRADFVLRNIGRLATLAGAFPRTGPALRDIGLVEKAAVAAHRGRIVFAGPEASLAAAVAAEAGATVIDAEGAAVVPGFVDAHTHLAYAGDRDDEIRKRLAGASYREIAEAGGGIVRSVEATRRASPEGLARLVRARLTTRSSRARPRRR
jgi:imidazolonepropionase